MVILKNGRTVSRLNLSRYVYSEYTYIYIYFLLTKHVPLTLYFRIHFLSI